MDMALHPPCRGRRPFLLACRSGAADVICLPCPATAAAARPPFSLFRLHPTAATLRNVRNAQRKRKSPVARRLELCSWRGLSAPHGNCRSSPAAIFPFPLTPYSGHPEKYNTQRKEKGPAVRRPERRGRKGGTKVFLGPGARIRATRCGRWSSCARRPGCRRAPGTPRSGAAPAG